MEEGGHGEEGNFKLLTSTHHIPPTWDHKLLHPLPHLFADSSNSHYLFSHIPHLFITPPSQSLVHLALLVDTTAKARLLLVVEALLALAPELLQASTLQEPLFLCLPALLQDLVPALQLRARAPGATIPLLARGPQGLGVGAPGWATSAPARPASAWKRERGSETGLGKRRA